MGKNDSFVDYANLGANLYQSMQLSGLRNQLTAIQQQAASDARQRELEAKMREIIFVNDGIIDDLEKYISRSPAGVAFLMMRIKDYLSNDYEISTEKFQSFDDKREVKKIYDKIHAINNQAVDKLDIDGVNDVKKNFELSFVISRIPKLMAHLVAKSSIKKIEKKYNKLVSKKDKIDVIVMILSVPFAIIFVFILIACIVGGVFPYFLVVIACYFCLPLWIYKKGNTQEYREYKKIMDKDREDLLSDSEADELLNTFGVDTCEGCDEISRAYNDYLNKITTTDTNGSPLDTNLLKLVYK